MDPRFRIRSMTLSPIMTGQSIVATVMRPGRAASTGPRSPTRFVVLTAPPCSGCPWPIPTTRRLRASFSDWALRSHSRLPSTPWDCFLNYPWGFPQGSRSPTQAGICASILPAATCIRRKFMPSCLSPIGCRAKPVYIITRRSTTRWSSGQGVRRQMPLGEITFMSD